MRIQRSWRDFQVPAKEEPRWVIWASFFLFLASIALVLWLATHDKLIPIDRIWPVGWAV